MAEPDVEKVDPSRARANSSIENMTTTPHTAPTKEPPSANGQSPRQSVAVTGEHAPGHRSALLIDWGGVLTSNLFTSFHDYCVRAEIDPRRLGERFKADPQFRALLIALEKGELEEQAFERSFAELLEVEPAGLIDGLFAGVGPDLEMIDAVRRVHDAGVRTALVSNSWGVHRYPHELFGEIFDGVVISGREGIRKPSRRMYELGAERAGVAASACVYVDDLPHNLAPAQELGMATVHHTAAETTIPELERLLGTELCAHEGMSS